MTAPPREKTLRYLIAGCSMAVFVAASSAAAFAHGGSQHRGGGNSGDGGSIARDGDHFHSVSGAASSSRFRILHGPASRHKRVVTHPTKFRPPVAKVGPAKAPSPYACPGGAKPNLPCGTPITVSQPGYTSCTFENGYNSGCDIYPMPTGSAVGGQQPGGHNQHHAD